MQKKRQLRADSVSTTIDLSTSIETADYDQYILMMVAQTLCSNSMLILHWFAEADKSAAPQDHILVPSRIEPFQFVPVSSPFSSFYCFPRFRSESRLLWAATPASRRLFESGSSWFVRCASPSCAGLRVGARVGGAPTHSIRSGDPGASRRSGWGSGCQSRT
jgi:hypothetical protein